MIMRALALMLLVGCDSGLTSNEVTKDAVFEEDPDEDAPIIVHDAISETQTFGADVPISATITDEGSGVLFAYLHYKNEIDGADGWNQVILMGADDVYTGSIRGEDEMGGGVDYYIEAVDKEHNTSYAPEDGASDPYHFRLAE